MSVPLVSVVVPTHDGSAYVGCAIESVLEQTLGDVELVVSDDGSRDDTLARVREVADGRVRILAEGPAGGAAGNWNRGVAAARGRFVKVLCQDDRLHPRCLEEQVAAMLEVPRAVLVGSGRRMVDARGRVLLPRVRAASERCLVDRRDLTLRCLARGTNVMGEPSAVLFDPAAFRAAGGFRPGGYVVDLDMWLRLLDHGDGVLLPEALVDFRVHSRSWSTALQASQRTATQALLRAAAAEAGLPPGRNAAARVGGRFLGRRVVYGVARLTRPSDPAPAATGSTTRPIVPRLRA